MTVGSSALTPLCSSQATSWLHVVLASFPGPGGAKLILRSLAALTTNATARAELCYSRSRGKRQTLQLGPNYATLVWHCRHLACRRQASTHISSLHEHVAARKILESLKNWSGHSLSNRTGSAGPVNPLPDFGRMLSVGAIRFEDGFCASGKGGTRGCAWVGTPLCLTVHGGGCSCL